ncbi:unnamed protein product [Spirodela intermedia]|uniref:Protein TIFY n=1 Tax=Spirodela intermedia TaxID=51605 RepID=A0A7I8KCH9_SPIIN|nr:unnamed protein product [Spirodela intermedia]
MAGSEAAPPEEAGRAGEEVRPGAGAAAVKSPLEKPLSELTEEDIAQVTREDCRRFLKEKGMRRPSWNKSQAVQQVISLKALLEPYHDADDDAPSAGAVPSISTFFAKRPSDALLPAAAAQFPVSSPMRGEPAGGAAQIACERPQGRDPPANLFACSDALCRFPATGNGARLPSSATLPPRGVASAEALEGQLTIFYDGKINVYDAVTPEKVRSGRKGPTSRAASLQRYLEKRKDRFKCKKHAGGGSSGVELLLSQRIRDQIPAAHLSCGEMYAAAAPAPRPPPPPARCSAAGHLRFSIDLNDGGEPSLSLCLSVSAFTSLLPLLLRRLCFRREYPFHRLRFRCPRSLIRQPSLPFPQSSPGGAM